MRFLLITALIVLLDCACAWHKHAEATRLYCPPPENLAQLRTTGYCPRVPTLQLPLCPAP